jgi:hypothetical protein
LVDQIHKRTKHEKPHALLIGKLQLSHVLKLYPTYAFDALRDGTSFPERMELKTA